VRCLTCHYDLKNLTAHRCPECGRAFDRKDASTFETSSNLPADNSMFYLVGDAFLLVCFLFGASDFIRKGVHTWWQIVPLIVAGVSVLRMILWFDRRTNHTPE